MRKLLALLLLAYLAHACVELSYSKDVIGNYSRLSVSLTAKCYGRLEVEVRPLSPVYAVRGDLGGGALSLDAFPGLVAGFQLYMTGPPKAVIVVKFNNMYLFTYYIGISKCLDARAELGSASQRYLGFDVPNALVVKINVLNSCSSPERAEVVVEGRGPLGELDARWCAERAGKVVMAEKCIESACAEWRKEKICVEREIVCAGGSCEARCAEEGYAYKCVKEVCTKTGLFPEVKYECVKLVGQRLEATLPLKGGRFEGVLDVPPRGASEAVAIFKSGPVRVYLNGEEIPLPAGGPLVEVEWVPVLASIFIILVSLAVIFLI
ncbi:MAG: hypothetical protein GXO07_02005 [Crenarchaeota archaeon]|nr:hypothetical protein [Thermoproteota archaeon]